MEPLESRNEYEKKIIVKGSAWTMGFNAFLAVMKIVAGILGRSSAIISDAVNSVSDVATGLAVLIFGRMSRKERDQEHQYGHEKYESVVSVFLGVALLLTAFEIGKSGVTTIFNHLTYGTAIEPPGVIALVAGGLTIVIKEAMYHFTKHYAKKAHSPALEAMALDHRSDVFSGLGVVIGIVGSKYIGIDIMEPIASVLICLLIVKLAIGIIGTALNQVVDRAADEETVRLIQDIVATHPGVKHLDDLKTRMFGLRLFVDMEIAVDAKLSIQAAHHIAHLLHDDIEAKIPNVKHCMIHVNPFKTAEID